MSTKIKKTQVPIPGIQVILVPYTHHHVETYHSWMQNELLLKQTGSLKLSLKEEYENCESWRVDLLKYTFLIKSTTTQELIGDVNCYLDQDIGELSVMVVKENRQGKRSCFINDGLLFKFYKAFYCKDKLR